MFSFYFEARPAKTLAPEENFLHLAIGLIEERNAESICIFKSIVENSSQLDWFLENENSIRISDFPFELLDGFSLAENINIFYENINPDDIYSLDAVYKYKLSHGFRFAFRGQDVLDVFVGRNKKAHEISCADGEIKFCHEVMIDSLFKEVDMFKQKYLSA